MSESERQPLEDLRRVPGGLLEGRRGLIVGVANFRSIAWGIARHAHRHGAELAFTYLGEALERRVRPLAESVGAELVLPLDVSRDEEIDAVFERIGAHWGRLDFLIHSIAYAEREDLSGRTIDTSRAGFQKALDISAYSLVALARRAEPLLGPGSSILAMTYYGSTKAFPSYNVMGIAKAALEASVRYLARDLGEKGIRINAISAGPIRTLASSAVSGMRSFLDAAQERAPLRRNISIDDVGKAAVYLLSDLAAGVTGEVHFVDAGLSTTVV
jgi:enoyl-[acyl-carrier protein] reductase I